MKLMERNLRPFYYALFEGTEDRYDEYGNLDGTSTKLYADAVRMKANISSSSGTAQAEQFGTDIQYDKVIVTDDLSCPIDEDTILWIDEEPTYDEDGNPTPNYIVKRVAESLNYVSYAISKVTVS